MALDAKGNELEFAPNAGVWDNGSEFQNQDNAGLNALFTNYPSLNGLAYPDWWDFAYLKALPTTLHQFVTEATSRVQNKDLSVYNGTIHTVNNITELISAYATASDLDIIQCNDGTYDLSDDPARDYLIFNRGGIGVLIRGNTVDNTAVKFNQNLVTSFGIRVNNCGEMAFQDLSIECAATTTIYTDGQYNNRSIVFSNCKLNNTSSDLNATNYQIVNSTGTNDMYLEFDNCELMKTDGRDLLTLTNKGVNFTLLITNCEIETVNLYTLRVPSSYEGSVYVYDSVLHNGSAQRVVFTGDDVALPATTIGMFDFRGNTLYSETTHDRKLFIGRGTDTVYCVNNIINGDTDLLDDIGLIVKSTAAILGDVVIGGNFINTSRPIYIKGASNNIINNNTFQSGGNTYEAFGMINFDGGGVDEEYCTNNEIKYNNIIGGNYGLRLYEAGSTEDIVTSAKTCDIDNNKYFFITNYLRDDVSAADVEFENRTAFWGNGNDEDSYLLSDSQIPVTLDTPYFPIEDYRQTQSEDGKTVYDVAVQPYEPVTYLGAVVKYLGETVTYLKEHLL